MICPRAESLLLPGAKKALSTALSAYPDYYDEVFDEVHHRMRRQHHATKLDLNALATWKRVRTTTWAGDLNLLPQSTVVNATKGAFARGIGDHSRVNALSDIPGFRARGAVTSALLAAWDPTLYGVLDKNARRARSKVVASGCLCSWYDLVTYEEHLRLLAGELSTHETTWIPRQVDMALYVLGKSHSRRS
jgi:hypothetical protein